MSRRPPRAPARRTPVRALRARAALLALLGVVAVVPAACSGDPGPADVAPDHVRVVVLPFLTMTPFHIAETEGWFEAAALDVELVRLPRIQELMAAVSRGEVDAAAGMLNVTVLNSMATGGRVRLVAALGYLTSQDCAFHGWLTRTELLESGRLDDPEQLRSLLVDANLLLPEAFWLDTWLNRMGLTIDDLELVDLPPAPTGEAVMNGSVDIAGLPEPLLSTAAARDGLAVWQRSEDMSPGHVVSVMMYGPTLLDDRPEVGERFAGVMLQAVRRFQEGKTPENLAAAGELTGLASDELSRACWPRTRDDARVDYATFRDYQEWTVQRGLMDRVLEEDEVIDHRFMDAANAEPTR